MANMHLEKDVRILLEGLIDSKGEVLFEKDTLDKISGHLGGVVTRLIKMNFSGILSLLTI